MASQMWPLSLTALVTSCIPIAALYVAWTILHRLYLSPLNKIPGPRLAALTTWYNGYYDVIKGGQYIFEIEEMHRQYGPVVRTRPDAVHVNDPDFIDKLYTHSPKQRRDRAFTSVSTVQLPGSVLSTADHDLHRKRRAILNPFFSQQNVRRLEPVIQDTLSNLLRRMGGWATRDAPTQLSHAYQAATKDVVQTYAFGKGDRYLDMEDCNRPFFEILKPNKGAHFPTYFPWIVTFLQSLPPSILMKIMPDAVVFAAYVEELRAMVESIKQTKDLPEGRTIFHEILKSDTSAAEKSTDRLTSEAAVVVIAGADTTARTMTCLTFQLLSNKELYKRLRAELTTVMPNDNDMPRLADLDKLPFLNALIQETIRLYPGATHRQDRVAPDEDLVYQSADGKYSYVLPAGTTIGMAAPIVNRNSLLYDKPDDFLPDRYLENPSLKRSTLSFSKGTRQCVGMALAYAELQIFVAGIFRKYDFYDPTQKQERPTLELFETTKYDIDMHADFVNPGVAPDSKGLRVRIRP